MPGSVAPPSATTRPPTTSAIALPNGNAARVASTACRPERAQRVKSAVMVPESAKSATTRVTAAPKLSAPAPAAGAVCSSAPPDLVATMTTATAPSTR
ncbi:hypothetical protein BC477_05880 [Clavibacter michiganensis subsp. michiganensis]|uniref:Uncharacterized protein n=1 Tax=Clavibacter michiganensis subsp. michiganensis TaxID=33013 RepID=A0A251XL85_CLAMM|nr:hypothetical protein BC477_05880 [Clavibacter michiganensis subsp. michiganensis]OUE04244.1 hypothetical protein CMMCAS07_04810 [Clavibacter michiganensis subsp. michiganensis]